MDPVKARPVARPKLNNKGSVPLQTWKEGDVVRMKTTAGFQHKAVVKVTQVNQGHIL